MNYEREKVVEFAREGLALDGLPLLCDIARSSIIRSSAFFVKTDD